MKAFFFRRPGMGVLVLITVFSSGGVLAWQTAAEPHRAPVALSTRAAAPTPAAPRADWREQLDLSRATVKQNKLVQRLPDGTEITYSLDTDLQSWATNYLQRYELPYGAMFMYDLQSGKTIVMAGYSARKPTMGAQDLCLVPWAPAASVFKLVTAAALLENGVPPSTEVCYHGGLRGLKQHHIEDHPEWDTACRTLSYAVAKSVNPVMAKLAVRYLNQGELRRWARRHGFNREIPFELVVQPSRAAIPSKPLELARVAAGFWHTETSVLHGAVIGGVAATGGELRWPRIVEHVAAPDGRVIEPERPEPERVMSRRSARRLARAMQLTTRIGTARRGFRARRGLGKFFLGDEIQVGGKTGSLSRSNPYVHYNWFVGFAPASRPRVAFGVLLGNPARWRIKAHTAARMLLAQYFEARRKARELREKQHRERQPPAVALASPPRATSTP